ncbi:MAG: aldehyde ferredoxin oxidoreductase family protein, partial [Spirochaetota bacterium]
LTTGRAERSPLEEGFAERYLGGRGFGARLVWDNLRARGFRLDPLGPENLLVVAPGPLTGTCIPSSGKCSFVSLSPATGVYGDSSMGGMFGVELRQAGVDVLSITGRAPELSVLFVDEEETRVIPMPGLAGKSCLEAEGMIKERLGSHQVSVAVIGPAGENLVRFACVNADWSRNAGRTGIGAVMGSKNLKALAVRGARDLPVHDLEGLGREAAEAFAYMQGHQFFPMWQREGLMNVMEYANQTGILPVHNFKDATYPRIEGINGETMLGGYKIGDSACFGCPMCCGNICLVKNGAYTGTVTEGPEYESCAMLGSNLGIDRFDAVLRGNQLCDELGVDSISTGSLVGAVIEGYERGIISLDELDGRPITWGDAEGVFELIGKIARREGIGDVLADGSRRVIRTWPQMEQVILQVKGLEQSAYESRSGISMALAYATSDIGAHHTRAWTIAREIELGKNWTDRERVDLVIYHQNLRPLFDMLGVCRLPWIELGINERHYAAFYGYVTGREVTLEELLQKSADIYDLTRLINTRLGMSRKDDSLPYKVYTNPIPTGPTAGAVIRREDFERLLDLYYRRRGWSPEGVPPESAEAKFA